MASDPITSWQIDGESVETVVDFIFWCSKITADGDWSHEFKRCLLLERKVMTNLDSIFKSRDITLLTKVHLQGYGFSSSHTWMLELMYKERWVLNPGVGEDSWESLNCKEIQPVHPKGNQSWVFIGRTDTETEAPILWPPDAEELTHWKRPWCWERLERQKEDGAAEDEMVR